MSNPERATAVLECMDRHDVPANHKGLKSKGYALDEVENEGSHQMLRLPL